MSSLFTKQPNGRYAPATIAQIAEAHAAYLGAKLEGQNMSAPKDAADYLRTKYAHEEREFFVCLLLDTRHRLRSIHELFTGTVDGATMFAQQLERVGAGGDARRSTRSG